MNQIQFFYDDELITLQEKINAWLQEHKEVKIIDTNLTSLGKPSPRAGMTSTEKYVFYILYTARFVVPAAEHEVAKEEILTPVVEGANITHLTN